MLGAIEDSILNQNVSGYEALSGLKGGLSLTHIGPALIGMVRRNRLSEHLLEIINGELQITLRDGHMGVSQCLLHEVDVPRPEILLQGESVAQAME